MLRSDELAPITSANRINIAELMDMGERAAPVHIGRLIAEPLTEFEADSGNKIKTPIHYTPPGWLSKGQLFATCAFYDGDEESYKQQISTDLPSKAKRWLWDKFFNEDPNVCRINLITIPGSNDPNLRFWEDKDSTFLAELGISDPRLVDVDD